MLSIQNVYKTYDERKILDAVDLTVGKGEVVALIGENGAGKTTLLKIILGEIRPDRGTVNEHRAVVGYVPQSLEYSGPVDSLLDARAPTWRMQYALEKVGLGSVSLSDDVEGLSGGQKTRLLFAQELAHEFEPDFLLLDEPTNNLDADGVKWLEDFITSYKGGILLVSHDRSFINQVADRVVELDDGTLRQYGGNYDFYKAQKAAEAQAVADKYEQFTEEKKRLKKLRDQKARQMQGASNQKFDKVKYEGKMRFNSVRNTAQKNVGRQLKALDSRLQQLGDVNRPHVAKNYKVSLDGDTPDSKFIFRVSGLCKSYGHIIFDDINFEMRGRDRVHLKGTNGSGKTTLLKIIADLVKPDSGEVETGAGVRIGYFSQDVDGLDYQLSGFENLQTVHTDSTVLFRQARSLGLTESDLKKLPGRLSRGQQAKLSFTKLLLEQNHVLLLDEPTNHLDIATKERIETALQDYAGAILVASHDEYFLQEIGITTAYSM